MPLAFRSEYNPAGTIPSQAPESLRVRLAEARRLLAARVAECCVAWSIAAVLALLLLAPGVRQAIAGCAHSLFHHAIESIGGPSAFLPMNAALPAAWRGIR